MVMNMARPGQRSHPHGGRSRLHQCLGRGAGRRAGGEDVVDDQNVLLGNRGGIGDHKCSAHVQSALAPGESSLALGGPQPHQRRRSQREPPLRMRLAQRLKRMKSQRASLVEAALGILRAVQRHRNHQHLGWRFIRQLSNCLGQHPAQAA